jgi:hypothetical protein
MGSSEISLANAVKSAADNESNFVTISSKYSRLRECYSTIDKEMLKKTLAFILQNSLQI